MPPPWVYEGTDGELVMFTGHPRDANREACAWNVDSRKGTKRTEATEASGTEREGQVPAGASSQFPPFGRTGKPAFGREPAMASNRSASTAELPEEETSATLPGLQRDRAGA